MPQRRSLPVAGLLAAVLVGCSHTTTPGAPQPPPRPSSSAPATVDAALLDPGKYPTAPLPPLGDAGSAQAGRLVAARRMAAYVVGPWQVDAILATAGSAGTAAVIEGSDRLGRVVWAPIAGGARGLPFVVGFVSERQSPGTDPQMSLRNAVLRFADPAAASAAAHSMSARAMGMPRIPGATPIVTQPEQAVPIPGHPDATGTLLTFQEGAQSVRELTVLTSHGPYVLVQVIRCAMGPDCEAPLAAHTLDLQLPLLDTFTPTAPDRFASLPLDPTGLVARTLPLPPDRATSTSGAAYPVAGALHLEDNPIQTAPALAAAGVDDVSVNLTTVYRARDAAGARTLVQSYSAAAAKTPAARAASAVPGIPQSRCTQVSGTDGLVPRYWCLAAAGRYAIKAVARQLDNAHQQVAAQYRMLTG